MEKAAIKDFIYGGLEEILSNSRYYHYSTIGIGYSHLTPVGEKAVAEFMTLVAHKIREAEDQDLDRRAKQQVIDQLKVKD